MAGGLPLDSFFHFFHQVNWKQDLQKAVVGMREVGEGIGSRCGLKIHLCAKSNKSKVQPTSQITEEHQLVFLAIEFALICIDT